MNKNPNKEITLADDRIINKIYLVRGQKVMLDNDLAEMYGVETRRLNESVKRNIHRFPDDFMFQLTEHEYVSLMSQNATSRHGGRRKLPYAFTEHGVLMLSSVLNSRQAIAVNIQIMRIFTRVREMLSTHKDLLVKLEAMEKKLLHHDHLHKKQEEEIQVIFETLKQLLEPSQEPRKRVGYRRKGEKE